MIRDPSDGSVKEKPTPGSDTGMAGDSPVIAPTTSGLPEPSARTAYQERLERSREWLRKYRSNPESVARMMGEQGSENV